MPLRWTRMEAHGRGEGDVNVVTADDLFGWQRDVTLGGGSSAGPLHGLCGWFDVAFCGRADAPAAECTSLDTSPPASLSAFIMASKSDPRRCFFSSGSHGSLSDHRENPASPKSMSLHTPSECSMRFSGLKS